MSPDDLPMADIPADTPMMSEEMLLLTVAQNPYIPAQKIPYPKQLQFLGLECRNALYGGAAGGGKSESLLMAALQFVHLVPNYSALIVRRSLSDLKLPGGLMDRALEWLRPHLKVRGGGNLRGGQGKKGTVVWNGADYKFTFPNGATLQFGYCDNDGDENRYHGAEFQCVAAGTLIRMGDNSLRAVEDVRPGQLVMTLEGPRRVTAVSQRLRKPCVECRVYDADGTFIGSQVHPESHPILTWHGWLDARDMSGGLRPFGTSAPNQFRAGGSISAGTALPRRVSRPPSDCSPRGLPQGVGFVPPGTGHPVGPATSACSANGRSCSESSGGTHPAVGPLPAWCAPVVLHAPVPQKPPGAGRSRGEGRARIARGAVPDCRCGCSSCLGPCDAPPLPGGGIGRGTSPSPAGADAQSPAARTGGRGTLPECTREGRVWYVHPYTMAVRLSSEAVRVGACECTPVGERDVFDLTVEDVNHYITDTGIINRNCVGLDEAVQFSEKQIIFFGSERIRKKADMAVPERYRLATTPGGPGHEFLRRWFIDPGTPGDVFIPANAWDNPGVDAESYIRGLQLLKTSDPLRYKQMVDGDWESVQGQTFKREWFGSWRIDRSLRDTMVLYAHRAGEVERFRPDECGRFQTCDPAISTSSKADKFVLSTWLITPRANLVWWGCRRGHFDFPTQLAVCRSEYRKYRPQFLAVENVAYQKALIDQLRTCRDPVMAVKEVAPGGKDKLARSVPAVAMAQAGRVFLPAEATPDFAVDEVLSEVVSFTGEPKRKDDAVDTFTYACMLLPFVRPGHAGYGTPAPFRHVGKLDFVAS